MERLPYIDEHSTTIGASRQRVWDALAATLLASLGRTVPGVIARAWGLDPTRPSVGAHATLAPGDALSGFTVARSQPPERLELRGRHRFSRYALVFELDSTADGGCTLRARSSARFPGLAGGAYRALVLGSGGHRLAVRRLLRDVARRA
jgi:hypothetical protein